MTEQSRCAWAGSRELDIHYHDTEWVVPVHDDLKHFEFILLDGFQAGLSWSTILKKRENFKLAFDGFDPKIIAHYNEAKLDQLLRNAGIIRNKLKVHAAVTNARSFLKIQKEFGSFDQYIWRFVDGKPINNRWRSLKEIPVSTPQSDSMSKDMKARGFKFVGITICYAYMQAAGLVNDHEVDCFRYEEILGLQP